VISVEEYEGESEYDGKKREKSMSKMNFEFLSNSFNLVLEGMFILLLLGEIFCVNAGKSFPISNLQMAFGTCRKYGGKQRKLMRLDGLGRRRKLETYAQIILGLARLMIRG
jgi:hypothetical protein